MSRRIVVDTNVWISALINSQGPPAQVLDALKLDEIELVLSQSLLDELLEVAGRPRIHRRYHLEEGEIEQLADLLVDKSVWVEPTGELRLCRDPDDDLILETALLGRAEHMVTRDDDIKRDLELIKWMRKQGVTVLSVSQFLELLKKE